MSRFTLRGLYAITDTTRLGGDALLAACEAALRGGARALQYRDKSGDANRRRREASVLVSLCDRFGIPLIVNDDLALALDVGAHGIHLGRDDATIAEARARLGDEALIGISCYDDLELAAKASGEGADYIAFGSFFASPTKPQAARADAALLKAAKHRFALPLVAIGGITPDNGASLVKAGADMLAVISDIFTAADPCAAASRYQQLFQETPANTERRTG